MFQVIIQNNWSKYIQHINCRVLPPIETLEVQKLIEGGLLYWRRLFGDHTVNFLVVIDTAVMSDKSKE